MFKSLILAAAAVLALTIQADAGEIRISVAASMKDVVTELTGRYQRQHPGVGFAINSGATGTLAKQIENGAPVDIFIAANQQWMSHLRGKGRVDAKSIQIFAFNTLVFVGRHDKNTAGMADLPRLARIAIGSPNSVPSGQYAIEGMRRAGIAGEIGNRLVMARDVREALMYAERGEVDGAFVYRTDALRMKRAKLLFAVPQQLYSRISYPMALTVPGKGKDEAAFFYAYLRSGEARAALMNYGFEVR